MVGKIKHVRQKLHQAAVKLDTRGSFTESAGSVPSTAEMPPALELHNTTPPVLKTKRDKQVSRDNGSRNILINKTARKTISTLILHKLLMN